MWSDYLDVSSWTGVKDTVRRIRMLSAVRANTVVSRSKLNTLYSLARRIESAGIDGIVAECGVQIEQAVGCLKDFKGLMPFTIEINRLENEADGLSRQAVADLFDGTHDFLDVIRWKEIYGRLENATDQCEDVANVIEAIVLKSR